MEFLNGFWANMVLTCGFWVQGQQGMQEPSALVAFRTVVPNPAGKLQNSPEAKPCSKLTWSSLWARSQGT